MKRFPSENRRLWFASVGGERLESGYHAGGSDSLLSIGEEYVAMYRVVLHDQGEPWYGLHEVEFDDAGQIAWWNRETASFKCDASDGEDGIVQLLTAAAGDAERWPVLKESELS